MGFGDLNRYPGKCARCGQKVEAMQGIVTYVRPHLVPWAEHIPPGFYGLNDAMVLEHRDCREKYAGTPTHFAYCPDPDLQKTS